MCSSDLAAGEEVSASRAVGEEGLDHQSSGSNRTAAQPKSSSAQGDGGSAGMIAQGITCTNHYIIMTRLLRDHDAECIDKNSRAAARERVEIRVVSASSINKQKDTRGPEVRRSGVTNKKTTEVRRSGVTNKKTTEVRSSGRKAAQTKRKQRCCGAHAHTNRPQKSSLQ